jgi:hypothetical protein
MNLKHQQHWPLNDFAIAFVLVLGICMILLMLSSARLPY